MIYDPKISGSGFGPGDLEDGDEATFFAVFEYGHEKAPTVHVVVLDGTEYELTASSGDIATGVNYTRAVELSEGSHSYSFRFEVEWDVLTTSTRSFDVDPLDDGDDPPSGDPTPAEEEGVNPIVIFVIVILVVAIVVVIYLMFIRKKEEPDEWDAEDYDETVVSSNLQGLNKTVVSSGPRRSKRLNRDLEEQDESDKVELRFKP